MAPIEFKRPKPAIFLLRPTDLSPAMLAVQVYGCASRTDTSVPSRRNLTDFAAPRH
jgi:hypothetical protein